MTTTSAEGQKGAPPPGHKTAKLLLAILTLVVAGVLIWVVDSAMTYQYRFLDGCWPQTVDVDGRPLLTEDFWSDRLQTLELNTVEGFFFSRVHHRILFYLLTLCAIVGWSGSFFLRFLRSEEGQATTVKPIPSWHSMIASFMLSGIAGAILFLLLVSGRLIVDPDGMACITEGYAYLAAAGGLGAGLFVVLFFEWFESTVKAVWKKIFSPV